MEQNKNYKDYLKHDLLVKKNAGRDSYYNKFQIPSSVLEKCIEKIRNKEPIVIDFLCHGSYQTKRKRLSVPGNSSLLTMAGTGYTSSSGDVTRTIERKMKELTTLLQGNMNDITKKVKELNNFSKLHHIRKKGKERTSFKLYFNSNSHRYNKNKTAIRTALVNKDMPPIIADFSNTSGRTDLWFEPGGVYLLEESNKIWNSLQRCNLGRDIFKKKSKLAICKSDFNNEEFAGGLSTYKEAAKTLLRRTKRPIPKETKTDKDEFIYKKAVKEYFYSKESSPWKFTLNNSMFIPNPNSIYDVSELMYGIEMFLQLELLKRNIFEKPVILFTFLQCKSADDKSLINKIYAASERVNRKKLKELKDVYKRYKSPSDMKTTGLTHEIDTLNTLLKKMKQSKTKIDAKTNIENKCKGLSKPVCKNTKECSYVDGAKRKYCKTMKTTKTMKKNNKVSAKKKKKTPPPKPEDCKGLAKSKCLPPNCNFTDGEKRKFCRKVTAKKAKQPKQAKQPKECKGLAKTQCNTEKHCKYVDGEKRKFCRTLKNKK